jgi:hypothetical protein
MITENEKKGRVKGQESRDYFDEYSKQMKSWGYMKRLMALTPFGDKTFGP